jgi:hypothetical protein
MERRGRDALQVADPMDIYSDTASQIEEHRLVAAHVCDLETQAGLDQLT